LKLWRIAADTPLWEAHELSGKGAELHGGRWNRPGRAVVYTSSSISLACLETMVHLGQHGLPLNRFLVAVEVPPDLWRARRILEPAKLPVGWSSIPEGKVSLDLGDAWLTSCDSALLCVPSVIVPEEFNVLINVTHPDASRTVAKKVRPWHYDGRSHGQKQNPPRQPKTRQARGGV
jgi:RES domain-containing protein